jgi:hypothetical protein
MLLLMDRSIDPSCNHLSIYTKLDARHRIKWNNRFHAAVFLEVIRSQFVGHYVHSTGNVQKLDRRAVILVAFDVLKIWKWVETRLKTIDRGYYVPLRMEYCHVDSIVV